MSDADPLFAAVQQYVQRTYGAGRRAKELRIKLEDGEKVSLPIPAMPAKIAPRPAHSPDFRSVNWFGTPYTFTAGQAPVVKLLWDAWENGTPELSGDYLMTEAGSEGRIYDLFRGSPAWNTLIVSTGNGCFRLAT